MKLTALAFRNKEVMMNNTLYTFDENGQIEVSTEVAKVLTEKYPKMFPQPKAKAEEQKLPVGKKTIEFEAEIQKLKAEIETLKSEQKKLVLSEDDIVLVYDMCKQPAKELKETVKGLGIDESEYTDMTHKELVMLLSKKVLNANT